MHHTQFSNGHQFPNEMNVKLDILCSSVMNWVLGEVGHIDVATIDDGGLLLDVDMELP
jgi:hypothetical protein